MKKIILVVSILIVALAAGTGAFLIWQKNQKPLDPANVLPAGPVFYSRSVNLASRIESFQNTRLFNELKNIDYKKSAAGIGMPSEFIGEGINSFEKFLSPENIQVMKEIFGKDVALAVYTDGINWGDKSKSPAETQELFGRLGENIFVVSRMSPKLAAAEMFLKLAGQFGKDFRTETINYLGKNITEVIAKDGAFKVAFARVSDYVVFGYGEKAAKTAIEISLKKHKSLAEDTRFSKILAGFSPDADSSGVLNFKPISDIISSQVEGMKKDPKAKEYIKSFEKQMRQIQSMELVTFESKTTELWNGKASLFLDKEKLDPMMKGIYSAPPQVNQTVKFVPWDALYYQWGSGLELATLWNQFKTQLNEELPRGRNSADLDKLIAGFEQMMGLSVEKDILPVLGKEFGGYLTDVDATGDIPIPKLVLFVQTTSKEKAENIITKLLSIQPLLRPTEETYNGTLIRYIPIPFAESFKLSYTFINDYLLLSSNLDVLKASLDAVKDSNKSIVPTALIGSSTEKRNSVVYVRFDRIMAKAGDLVDWSVRMNQQALEKRQAFINGSKKNLDDLKAKKENIQADIVKKKNDLARLDAPENVTSDLETQKETLKKAIDTAEKEIVADDESIKNLQIQIKSYETRVPNPQDNTALIDGFVKPLLKALANIRYLGGVTINGDGVVESISQGKIE